MYKRWISLLLAMILTVSLVLPGNAVALTTDAQENTEVVDETIEATGTTEPSDPTETTDATEPSDPTGTTDAAEPSEPAETTGATEPSKPAETTGATEPSEPTEAADQADSEEPTDPSDVVPEWIDETLLDGGISVMSMRPIPEVFCSLVLYNFSDAEIDALTIDDVLANLKDANGNSVSVSASATTAWRYVMDESDNIETYETYTLGAGEKIDLAYAGDASAFQLQLIVGSGGQLASDSVRYIIRVYVTNTVSEEYEFELYTQSDDGTRSQVTPDRLQETYTEESGISMVSLIYMTPSHTEGAEYYFGFSSLASEHPNISVDVYTTEEFMNYLVYGASAATSIADQMLNQNMEQPDAGYKGCFDAPTSAYDTKNTFYIVYSETSTGNMMSFQALSVCVGTDMAYVTSELYGVENDAFVDISLLNADSVDFESLDIDFGSGAVNSYDAIHGHYYMLKEGYSADDEYYFSLNAHSTIWDDANSHVEKAVVGIFDSLDAAAGQEDIKDQLIPVDRSTVPYGYKANYNYENEGIYFTVFFDDGSIWCFNARVMAYNPKYDPDYMLEFTDAPIVGQEDPWFRVTGVNDASGNALDAYIVENGDTVNMDTSYGYGNQTIFINDSNADLTQLQPTIWRADSDRITVYVNGILYNEGDIIDCTGMVTFTAIIDGHQKTYNVNFMKKSSGPSLYVFGSTTREVLLDEYFEKKHDILIANMGDEELTGLRVELNATNCQLDEYWTIGGNGNDTLAPFTETSSDTEYGELNNLAKIRLIPVDEEDMVGNGEIEGTLTIYADGQEPVVITLTGQALNPKITTNQESFASYTAVKYVPYAYVITTSNMHDWIDTSFTMTGDLPAGMEFYPETGEIYGVPQETGEFNIRIEASFESETSGFESSVIELTLTVLDNTNENVYEASDANYQIKQHVGTQTGDYDFVLETIEDTVFTSYGEFGEFVDIWLNGEKLVEGVDYEKEEGSTKITIKSQTIEDKANDDGSENTIAMEFRTETESEEDEGELKRTAQNFTVKSSVEKVIEMIDALPSSINLSHKSAVQAARAAYDALSETDKAKVTNYSKLTAAEATIAQLEANQTAANKVINLINNLPSTITLADKEAVEAARAAYDALTSAQKNLVTNYERLQKAESAIAQLEAEQDEIEKNKAAAKVVVDLIDALPSPITLADKDAVSAARAAYNNLTADQKGYVTNYDKLTAAEATIAELEAKEKEKAEVNAVIALINEIPNPVTLADKETVAAARAGYDALSPEQQESVVNYKTLTDAEATIAALEAQQEADEADKAAADAVVALIDAIPDPVTLDDKETVEAAREAYDALTDTQKQLVSNYSDLTDAEAAIKTLEDYEAAEEEDRAAADSVIDLIDALPDEITLDDKEQVEEARDAYDDLTENQQSIVTNYDELIDAEAKIAELENSEYEETLSVTLVAIFVDDEGNPLSDSAIELHSVVQTGRTDENGSILFTGVEFGEHTIYTKDANGNITSQKGFTIVLGAPLSLNGDVITAENGSVFTVTFQQNGSTLTFLSVEEGNQAPEVDTGKDDENSGIDIGESEDDDDSNSSSDDTSVKTADETHLMFWNTLMFVSLAGFLMVPVCFGRKRGKYEKRR